MSDQENHQNLLSKQYIDTLVASDDATIRATDLKNTEQKREVIVTAGKIRIQVDKGNLTNG
jgi:hypothetical protein